MIQEYALEPALVATWTDRRDARYFAESFGIGRARLVSRFPKRWRREVYDEALSLNTTPMGRKRIEELLARFSEHMVKRRCGHFDSKAGDWFENAMREHEQRPFHAILARANPKAHPEVLVGEDVSEESHPLWSAGSSRVVERRAADMADAVAPVLRISSVILFVDPYFSPAERRYRRTLAAFLHAAATARPGGPPERIEVLLSSEHSGTERFFRQVCGQLSRCVPSGLQVVLRRLAEKPDGEKLHNRYVLTDLGGMEFGVGLDEGNRGQTDDLTLLGRTAYGLRWSQYSGEPPRSFSQEGDPVTVNGSAEA